MKKIIVFLAAAALFCSCSGDSCKCSYKDSKGNTINLDPIAKSENTNCSEVAKTTEEKLNAGSTLLGSDYKVKVSCSTVKSE